MCVCVLKCVKPQLTRACCFCLTAPILAYGVGIQKDAARQAEGTFNCVFTVMTMMMMMVLVMIMIMMMVMMMVMVIMMMMFIMMMMIVVMMMVMVMLRVEPDLLINGFYWCQQNQHVKIYWFDKMQVYLIISEFATLLCCVYCLILCALVCVCCYFVDQDVIDVVRGAADVDQFSMKKPKTVSKL